MDIKSKSQKENEDRVAEEYLSSLSDLNCNSKPLINMLTMLAEENIEFAAVIVKVVEQHITKVPSDFKLPILYLIDSIVKNVKGTYVQLFSQCIVNIFCGVFEKINEKVRERMYALRQTWNEVFSPQKLYTLDVKVKCMDNNWPITAKHPKPSIHVNPDFLKTVNAAQTMPTDMEEILHVKTRELLELKKRKLELELEATKKHLEEQEKQLSKATESVITPVETMVAANPLTVPVTVADTVVSGIVNSGIMSSQHHIHAAASTIGAGDMRSGMFHPSYRNQQQQQQQQLQQQLQHPMVPGTSTVNMPAQGYPSMNNMAKPKVNPVNPALLNTVRQRDPRLARQQQIIQSHAGRSTSNISENAKSDDKSYRAAGSKTNRNGGASESESKTTARHFSSPSSNRSSGRSSKSNSSHDKDKDRKRSESKTSTTSYSSTGSSSSSERRKHSSSGRSKEVVSKYDKDAFEITPLSAFKRKSSSPAASPTKSKDLKRSSKSRNYSQYGNRSRSRSPATDGSLNQDNGIRTMPPTQTQNLTDTLQKHLSDSHIDKEDHKAVHTSKDYDKSPLPKPLSQKGGTRRVLSDVVRFPVAVH